MVVLHCGCIHNNWGHEGSVPGTASLTFGVKDASLMIKVMVTSIIIGVERAPIIKIIVLLFI